MDSYLHKKSEDKISEYIKIISVQLDINLKLLESMISKFLISEIPSLSYEYQTVNIYNEQNKLIKINSLELRNKINILLLDIKDVSSEQYELYNNKLFKIFTKLDFVSKINDELLILEDLIFSRQPTQNQILLILNEIQNFNDEENDSFISKIFSLVDEYLSKNNFEIAHIKVTWQNYLLNYIKSNIERIFQGDKSLIINLSIDDLEELIYESNLIVIFCNKIDIVEIKKMLKSIVSRKLKYIRKQDVKDEIDINLLESYYSELKSDLLNYNQTVLVEKFKPEFLELINTLVDEDELPDYYFLSRLIKLSKNLLYYNDPDSLITKNIDKILNIIMYFKKEYIKRLSKTKNKTIIFKYRSHLEQIENFLNLLNNEN